MKRKNNLLLTFKIFMAIAYPYTVAVAALIVLLSAAVIMSRSYLFNNANSIMETKLQSINDSIGITVTNYNKIGEILSATTEMNEYASSYDVNDIKTASLIPRIQTSLINIMDIANVDLDDLSVYYPNSNSLITVTASYQGNVQCDAYFMKEYHEVVSREVLGDIPQNMSRIIKYIDEYGVLIRQVATEEGQIFYILIKFNFDDLLDIKDGIAFIGDNQNCIYVKGMEEEFSQEQYISIYNNVNESRLFEYNNQQYAAKKSVLSIMGREIIVGLPVSFEQSPLNIVYKTAVGLLIIVIMIFAVSVFILNRQIVSPSRKLAEAMLDKTDYFNINNVLTTAMNNLESLERQNDAMKAERNYLIPLGVGELLERISDIADETKTRELAGRCVSLCGLEEGQKFCVVGLYCSNDKNVYTEAAFITEELHIRWRSINELLCESLFVNHVGILAITGKFFMLLCNVNEEENAEDIWKILNEVSDIYKSKYNIKIIGSPIHEVENSGGLSQIVRLTLKEISYLEFWRQEQIIISDEKSTENDISLLKLNRNLINRLDAKDYEGARQLFNQLVDERIPSNVNTLDAAKSRIQGMIEMLAVTIEEHKNTEFDDSLLKMLEKLQNADNIDEFRMESERIFEKLIDICEVPDNKLTGARLMKKVADYIDKHYMENDIGLATIAEKFGISKTYLSRTFKAAFEDGILEYIHKKRITEAKKLLADHSVNSVAIKVGFWDAQGFIRVFKKLEGVTPGEYKQHNYKKSASNSKLNEE